MENSKKTKFDVYETLCPQQMLVHKGGQIKNWSGEYRDIIPTKLQGPGGGGGGGGVGFGGQGGCERGVPKIKFFLGGRGGGVGLGGSGWM